MSCIAYVDGFNLYKGFLEKRPQLKWLDLLAMSRAMTDWPVERVKYFTSRVKNTPSDPSLATRQDVYLRALLAHGGVKIYEGNFQASRGWRPIVKGEWKLRPPPAWARVKLFEEKGSDVNLASHLLVDSLVDGKCDSAVIVTNDSDLKTPIMMLRERGVGVLVVNPHPEPAKALAALDVEIRQMSTELVEECLLPQVVQDGARAITRPATWA